MPLDADAVLGGCYLVAIKGADKHKRRLNSLIHKTAQQVTRGLYVAGQLIELSAEKSITQGSISGAGHIPSRPGEPPNADTRFLDMNIETHIVSQSPPHVRVISNAPYSAALEFGTSKMAERPFMRPATIKHEKDVRNAVATAVARVVRSS